MAKYPMTPDGKKKLEVELKHIREFERPINVKAIEEAIAQGDLSENAEYKYEKEKQGMLAGRMEYLEDRISGAEVIDPTTFSGERVVFGAKVTLEDLDTEETVIYRIVGEDEANIEDGDISVNSPIARGLIRHEIGDEVRIKTPKGMRSFEISDVEF